MNNFYLPSCQCAKDTSFESEWEIQGFVRKSNGIRHAEFKCTLCGSLAEFIEMGGGINNHVITGANAFVVARSPNINACTILRLYIDNKLTPLFLDHSVAVEEGMCEIEKGEYLLALKSQGILVDVPYNKLQTKTRNKIAVILANIYTRAAASFYLWNCPDPPEPPLHLLVYVYREKVNGTIDWYLYRRGCPGSKKVQANQTRGR
jgi:hypothetical protein